MSKAEKRACQYTGYSGNQSFIDFLNGYYQAEKDLELGWKDIKLIGEIIDDVIIENLHNNKWFEEELYMEVLKRFKEMKGEEV